MKKILFIIWSHSLGGGAEALLTMIVNHLDAQKYQIGIIEFYHSTIKKEPVNSYIKVYEPVTFEGDTDYQKKMYYVHHEPERMIRKYIPTGYDLYVSFNYQIPSFLLPEGTRNIAWIHGAVFDLAESEMEDYRHLQSKAFDKTVKIVSISDITTKSIKTIFPEHADKLVEIYNAVNIKEIRENADVLTKIVLRHPAIIWVGRLDDNKNPLRMLDIFRAVYKENHSAHLYFLGKGEQKEQVQKKVNEYELQGQVHILGYIENPFPVIRQADVCCMTSKSEGFPMSLIECIALDVPFVSTVVGGAKILSNGGSCGRVYEKDEEAVREILWLLQASKDSIKKKCAESVRRFGLGTYISKIEELFDGVLETTVDAAQNVLPEYTEDKDELEDRKYYYHFPETLFSKDKKVILYGAGDIGTNYYNYMKEKGYYVTTWIDGSAEKYRSIGKDVKDIDVILDSEYDVILIAVMNEGISQSIRMDLCKRGIPNEKILWAKPIF